jgi:hypothetical protein
LKALIGIHRDGKTEATEFSTPKLPGCETEEEGTGKKVYQIKKEETRS